MNTHLYIGEAEVSNFKVFKADEGEIDFFQKVTFLQNDFTLLNLFQKYCWDVNMALKVFEPQING